MLNKDIDGIKKIPADPLKLKQSLSKLKREVRLKIIRQPRIYSRSVHNEPWYKKLFQPTGIPAISFALILILAFSGGAWTVLVTSNSKADDQINVVAQNEQGSNFSKEQAQINNPEAEKLFTTPIQQLKDYIQTIEEPDKILKRKAQIRDFLEHRNSPLASESETFAQQPHWKLILAIAFAESTLGKHCYSNNCSGIGGAKIKSYATSKQWIVDFNRLLEKRYKDKSLEQMCGVYVQPCNPNWLLATKQILDSLDEKGIE